MQHPGLTHLAQLPLFNGRTVFELRPTQRVLVELGNPQDKIRSIHVAGTNGKGTVCSLISAMLWAAGNRVGQYSSPHLSHVTERCLLNGQPVEEERLGAAILRVAEAAKRCDESLSSFEVLTIASFLIFAEAGLDWMVIEVGLGGRLDSTNTLKHPALSIITTVDLDHTEILGTTVAAIAKEKAGILKTGVPALCGEVSPEAHAVILQQAGVVGTTVEFAGVDFGFDEERSTVISKHSRFPFPQTLLQGWAEFQLQNAMLAIRAAQLLGLNPQSIERGLLAARWPGRVEFLQLSSDLRFGSAGNRPGKVLLDVAHNPQGVQVLIEYLRSYLKSNHDLQTVVVLMGVLGRKDWRSMIDEFLEFEDELRASGRAGFDWVFGSSADDDSVDPTELRNYSGRGSAHPEILEALQRASDISLRSANPLVVVTGSVYFVGKLRPILLSAENRAEQFRTIAGS